MERRILKLLLVHAAAIALSTLMVAQAAIAQSPAGREVPARTLPVRRYVHVRHDHLIKTWKEWPDT